MKLTGENLYELNPEQRKEIILDYSTKERFAPPKNTPIELQSTFRISKALNEFLVEYFKSAIKNELRFIDDKNYRKELIQNEIDLFIKSSIENLKTNKKNFEKNAKKNPKNLFELGGAFKLAYGNNATRTLSTKLGLLWEKIACISPLALNPENDFKIKLNGVDAIIYIQSEELIIYTQLKTQKNTLTGSQTNRSVAELTLHENRQLVACFETSASWTFNSIHVNKVCGAPFWESIGFEYDEILNELKRLMPKLDEGYIDLL